MAHTRSSASNPGYTGYPARIYYEMTAYGRGSQELKEKMVILEKWYSHLRAYLPVHFAGDTQKLTEEKWPEIMDDGSVQNLSLLDMLAGVANEIQEMESKYDGMFEGGSCNSQEKEFLRIMRGVFERLDLITAAAEIIDKVSMPVEVEV